MLTNEWGSYSSIIRGWIFLYCFVRLGLNKHVIFRAFQLMAVLEMDA
jgi:hypothetical protein